MTEKKREKSFSDRIYEAVSRIPRGTVATYGQIAAAAGNGGAARAVGNALHRNPLPGVIPCHRVVSAQGRLAPHFAFGGEGQQQKLLEAEGVEVIDCRVDLKKYQMR
ncbi:MAG: MGMT family protein [Ruminococcus sp.]